MPPRMLRAGVYALNASTKLRVFNGGVPDEYVEACARLPRKARPLPPPSPV